MQPQPNPVFRSLRAQAGAPVRLVQDDFDGAYDDVPARAIAAA